MSVLDPCLIRSRGPGGEPVLRLAAADDLRVFFTVVGEAAQDVRASDVLGFITDQRNGGSGDTGLRPVQAGEAPGGVASSTVARRLSTISGFLAYLQARGASTYVLDEPTSGLHLADVDHLIGTIDRIVDGGGTAIVIERNLDVVARADWVIDLGPGAGHDGGNIVFEGTPADLVEAPGSLTGEHLRRRIRRRSPSLSS